MKILNNTISVIIKSPECDQNSPSSFPFSSNFNNYPNYYNTYFLFNFKTHIPEKCLNSFKVLFPTGSGKNLPKALRNLSVTLPCVHYVLKLTVILAKFAVSNSCLSIVVNYLHIHLDTFMAWLFIQKLISYL